MKVSFISTVFNEDRTINEFLKSIFQQSTMPDEIIIVDGGSRDETVESIKYYVSSIKRKVFLKNIKFSVTIKYGNRAVGRNEAIKNARGDIIVCSDAGCILDKNWIRNIIEPFNSPKVDVVAGYYKGLPKSIFEKCLIPYVLIMEDKINSNNFLPASRSMAFYKKIWEKIGGFPEEFSNNEDYVFAKKLKKIKANIVFEKKAVVYWLPRNNIKGAFVMFYRFAKGDSESCVFRPKVALMLVRYGIGIIFLFSFLIFKLYFILYTLYFILFIYVFWSIVKNYRYVKDWKALFYLPLIQFVSDIAVIIGTTIGIYRSIFYFRIKT